MTIHSTFGATLVALSLVAAAAHAEVAPAAPAAPKPTMAFSFEMTPELYATKKTGSNSVGDLADDVAKFGLSKTLPNGVTVGGSLSGIMREPSTSGVGSSYATVELSASYKFKVSPVFTVAPSVALGYAFGELPKILPTDATGPAAYYALSVAADYKLSKAVTFNVINVRYRNAFATKWLTPKVSSGVTYALDDTNSAYFNVGKSWKDTGAGLVNDKYSISIGLKHSF